MFEVWVSQENPSIHLVKAPGTPLPPGRPMMNWSLLGTARVTPVVAATVERDGRAEVVSVVPFDPNGIFGPAGEPVGPQSQVPR